MPVTLLLCNSSSLVYKYGRFSLRETLQLEFSLCETFFSAVTIQRYLGIYFAGLFSKCCEATIMGDKVIRSKTAVEQCHLRRSHGTHTQAFVLLSLDQY